MTLCPLTLFHSTLPIMYNKFTSMAQPGDIIYIARYLVSGAEASSLYLKVCNSR